MILSTPYWLARLCRATLLVVLCLALWTVRASAAECAEDANMGVCLDNDTFQWCHDGELKTVECPEGHICVSDNPWYDGAGCVAPGDTPCGDIPPQGECTTANSVAWCDEGVPRVQPCDEDSVCGWDETNGWYDCLPTTNMAPSAPPDPSGDVFVDEMGGDASSSEPSWGDEDSATSTTGSDDIGPEPEGTEFAEAPGDDDAVDDPTARDDVPTPRVMTGGAADTDDETSPAPPATGCSGGAPSRSWPLWLLALVALSRRRRADSAATA